MRAAFTLPRLTLASAVVLAVATAAFASPSAPRAPGSPPPPPRPPAAVGCLDEKGAATPCDFGVAPVRLPTAHTVAEDELAVLARGSTFDSALQSYEWSSGGAIGSCRPVIRGCDLSTAVRGAPQGDGYGPAVASAPSVGGVGGDAAIAKGDLNGDGREELVLAARCPGTNGEICLSLDDAASTAAPKAMPTGLYASPAAIGRTRIAVGPIAQSPLTVTGASFALADDGTGIDATFTTRNDIDLIAGQAIRFDPGAISDLKAALCIAPDACLGDTFGDDYQPVDVIVGPRSFTIRLGLIVNNNPDLPCPEGFTCLDDGTAIPNAWSGEVDAVGTRSGVALAYIGPGATIELAAFTVATFGSAPFLLGDIHAIGTVRNERQPIDIAIGNFDGGAASQIVVAYAGTCPGVTLPCSRLSFFRWNGSRQLQLLSSIPYGPAEILAGGISPTLADPQEIVLATGNLVAGGNQVGDDIAIGWLTYDPACDQATTPPCVGRILSVADVSSRLTLTPKWRRVETPAAGSNLHSPLAIAVGDLDVDGLDDLVVASATAPDASPGAVLPLRVDAWKTTNVSGVPDATLAMGAVSGGAGSGQLAVAIGKLARNSAGNKTPAEVAAALNPEVVVAWTCSGETACAGATGGSGDGIAVVAAQVNVPIPGAISFFHQGSPALIPAAIPPALYDPVRGRQSHVAIALPDLDGDSVTLGTPRIYQSVGAVRPMMILRSPPVHFDAIDRVPDNRISYAETLDLSSCFGLNGLPKYNNECGTYSEVETTNTQNGTIAGSVDNSYTLSGGVKGERWTGELEEGRCKGAATPVDVEVCTEIELFVDDSYNRSWQTTSSATHEFQTSITQTAVAGQDAAFLYVESKEIQEYPLYAGASPFGSSLRPISYVRVDTPTSSKFTWASALDPALTASAWQSSYPGNIFSYARSVKAVDAFRSGVVSVAVNAAAPNTTVDVETRQGHGLTCDLGGWIDASTKELADLGNLSKFPCSLAASATKGIIVTLGNLRGGSRFEGSWQVRELTDAAHLRLVAVGPHASFAGSPTWTSVGEASDGELTRSPGLFGDTKYGVYYHLRTPISTEVSDQSQFEGAISWSNDVTAGGSIHAGFVGKLPFGLGGGLGVTAHFEGNYHDQHGLSRVVAATTGTKFSATIDGALPDTQYQIQPILRADPATGAMVFDWTADCATNCTTGIWRQYNTTPDPAFALPSLLRPYEVPTGLLNGDELDSILRSPDFQSWDCGIADANGGKTCRPLADHTPGVPWELATFVHNYSTKVYASDQPLKVRFFLGDPARGGQVIAEASISGDRDALCAGRRSCILPNGVAMADKSLATGRVLALAPWTPPPGVGGRGSSANVVPIYGAIIVPKKAGDVHPWPGPVDIRLCASTYPRIISQIDAEYKDGPSRCPSTNNEAYFPVQFSGETKPPVNLTVGPKDVRIAKDGRSATVRIHNAKGYSPLKGRVVVRLWTCAGSQVCRPQVLPIPTNGSSGGGLEKTVSLTLPPGAAADVEMPLKLRKGTTVVSVQVAALDSWEETGGPGVTDNGDLVDNERLQGVSCVKARALACAPLAMVKLVDVIDRPEASAIKRLMGLGFKVRTFVVRLGKADREDDGLVASMSPDPTVQGFLPKGATVLLGIGHFG